MNIADCNHIKESTIGVNNGLRLVTCDICSRARQYRSGEDGSEVITRIGRIGSAIIVPPAGSRFNITPEESRFVKEGWDIINEREGKRRAKGSHVSKRETKPVSKPASIVSPEPEPVSKPASIVSPEPEPVSKVKPEPEEVPVHPVQEEMPVEAVEAPAESKIYYCKKCDYSTPDKYKLISHYSSAHSWHHREQAAIITEPDESVSEPAPEEVADEKPLPYYAGRKETGEWRKCIDCGEPIYIQKYRLDKNPEAGKRCGKCNRKQHSPPPSSRKPMKQRLFFAEHREEILTDYGDMLIRELEKKWGMTRGYFYYLRNCWEKEGITIPTAYADRNKGAKEESVEEQIPAEVNEEEKKNPVPHRPKGKHSIGAYWERNKEAVISDYYSMKLLAFLRRWGVATYTWGKLKKRWGVQNKQNQPAKQPAAKTEAHSRKLYKKPQLQPGELCCILVTEGDLAKLNDEQFLQQWELLGIIIRNRGT